MSLFHKHEYEYAETSSDNRSGYHLYRCKVCLSEKFERF